MIDSHCHIDLHDHPLKVISELKSSKISCVSVSMLPSHYKLGLSHLESSPNIFAALGFHPLRALQAEKEVNSFLDLSRSTDYIGEIGLDFSPEGISTQSLQENLLLRILPSLKGGKFVTVHSREAEIRLLEMLSEAKVSPVCFHYFTGSSSLAEKVIAAGHYLSLNRRMLIGRHKGLLDIIPRKRILIESDAPFLTTTPHRSVQASYSIVSKRLKISPSETIQLISENFRNCRTTR